MANIKLINKAIKAKYPGKDIELVKGPGYVYFGGDDGFDKVPSIYSDPRGTPTETLLDAVLWQIEQVCPQNDTK